MIQCEETGEIFSSIRALERHLNISHGKMIKLFKNKSSMEYNNLHYSKGENK